MLYRPGATGKIIFNLGVLRGGACEGLSFCGVLIVEWGVAEGIEKVRGDLVAEVLGRI